MKKETIQQFVILGNLRLRQFDPQKVKSMIESSEINVEVAKDIPLNDKSATLVFREIYESIRQLGEAKWWIEGYEPQGPGSHTISLDILKEISIKEKIKFNHLERFRNIRHDANYRGFRVTIFQAKEIIDFWDKCGKEIVAILKEQLDKKEQKPIGENIKETKELFEKREI